MDITLVKQEPDEKLTIVDENINTTDKKQRRKWQLQHEFDTKEEAENFLKDEGVWGFFYRNNTSVGEKRYYRCNIAKRRKQQCDAVAYLLFHCNSHKVTLYKTFDTHTHHNLEDVTVRMSEELKSEIESLFDLNISPKNMYDILLNKGYQLKNKVQLSNYLATLKKKLYRPTTISLSQIEQWCIDNSDIPDSDNTAYVFYEIEYPDEMNQDEASPNEHQFKMFLTSRNLLKNTIKSDILHADSTYKIVWEGLPVLIVGVTDADRKFHPSGLAICTNEGVNDFKFIFKSLKMGITAVNEILDPICLVSDASNAVRNAFLEVFGDNKKLIMCWTHMRRNISENIDWLVKAEHKEEVLADVDSLHLSSDELIFDKAVDLFIKKWEIKEEKFIDYMNRQWLTSHRNWYVGAAKRTPSTNDGLESFNHWLKNGQTFREKLPLSRFLEVAKLSVERWSNDYTNRSKKFETETTISLSQWTESYTWARLDIMIRAEKNLDTTTFYCPTECLKSSTMEDLNDLQNWETFEDYKLKGLKLYIAVLPNDKDQWMKGSCTCPSFFKLYICKHVIGLAIRIKYVKPPLAAKMVALEEKRRRGRPKSAYKGLIVN